MAYRKGYQYITVLVPEDTYGTVKTGATTGIVLPDVCLINDVPEKIETQGKTLSLEPKKQNALLGASTVDVSLSGNLGILHQELLKMAVLDSTKTTPYTIQTDQGAKYSWTIFQYFAIPSGAIKCTQATGCVLKQMKISGAPGGTIMHDTSFIAKDYAKELAWPITGYTPSMPADLRPFLFCKSTMSAFSLTKMDGFDLTLTNNFIDDKQQLMNALSRQEVIATGTDIEMNLQTPYDSAQSIDAYLSNTLAAFTLSLIDAKTSPGSFVFTMKGHLAESKLQDPNRGRYTNEFKMRMAGDNSNTALSIAYTAGS
jgi:hypothetical protein